MADSIKADIKKNEENYSACVRVIDGKISAEFQYSKYDGSQPEYSSIPKIFDNWNSFVTYAKEFFKNN